MRVVSFAKDGNHYLICVLFAVTRKYQVETEKFSASRKHES